MRRAFSVAIMDWTAARAEAGPIRFAVFVAEQGVPAAIELDEWDARSDHALARDARGVAVGTGRLLPDGHIGRMAVLPDWRGRGLGAAILAALVERAAARGMSEIALNAQTQARGFYARHGFAPVGTEFMEAGIPHIAMTRRLNAG
ncbi:MAG: GNAT family N-acetyltransferase [Burkholderiales bacterium]|nr:GNAT family N-acetyltransferase [Burkholderiales bacterium]